MILFCYDVLLLRSIDIEWMPGERERERMKRRSMKVQDTKSFKLN